MNSSHSFTLDDGTHVTVDPSQDQRVIFTVIPAGGQPDSFTYSENDNTMEGVFKFTDANFNAIKSFLLKRKSGEI